MSQARRFCWQATDHRFTRLSSSRLVLLQIREDLLQLLLPYLLAGLGKGSSTEYRLATYMIAAQLSSCTRLSDAFISGQSYCRVLFVCECSWAVALLDTPALLRGCVA